MPACHEDAPPTPDETAGIELQVDMAETMELASVLAADGRSLADAAALIVTIVDERSGTQVYSAERVGLYDFDGTFLSHPLSLSPGVYALTELVVVDASGNALYAAPLEGSDLAHLVADPLEISFTVIRDTVTTVRPQVVSTEARLPQNFGYASFAIDVVMRLDPDVILMGEMRDAASARVALDVADTGHLFLSILHARDAVATVTALRNFGLEDFEIAASVDMIIAQRLVRRVCPDCSTPVEPDPEFLASMGLGSLDMGKGTFRKGKGCARCHDLGYKGRFGVFETLIPNSRIRDLILRGATEEDIRLAAQENGMRTLVEDGIEKVRLGETTLEDLVRVLEVREYAAGCCTGCGRQLNSEYRFCPYCRTMQRRICMNCGSPMHSGWNACAHCGQVVHVLNV